MQQESTHIIPSPAKRGGWGKKKRYDVTLTTETADRVKRKVANFSGLMDGLLSKWAKRELKDEP